MQPMFQGPNYQLFLGDVFEVMEALPDSSVDMIFADPPYNLSNDGFTCHAGKMVSVNKGSWDKSRGVEEDFKFHEAWIAACQRVLKPNGTLWVSGTYHSIYACGYALQKSGWHILNEVSWYKPNASPNLSCRMFTASHETLIWTKKSREAKQIFNDNLMRQTKYELDVFKNDGKQMRSVWSMLTPREEEKRFGKHPTQKPEALLERIVLASTNEGDTVLDPFCGSATTGVASLKYGRKFIGIDITQEYLENLAKPRLEAVETKTQSLVNHKNPKQALLWDLTAA